MAMKHLYKECIHGNTSGIKGKNVVKDIGITLEEIWNVMEETREGW